MYHNTKHGSTQPPNNRNSQENNHLHSAGDNPPDGQITRLDFIYPTMSSCDNLHEVDPMSGVQSHQDKPAVYRQFLVFQALQSIRCTLDPQAVKGRVVCQIVRAA